MPIEPVQAVKYTCDGCEKHYTVWGTDPVPGILGSARVDNVEVQWFAHTFRCIGPAVRAAAKRKLDELKS